MSSPYHTGVPPAGNYDPNYSPAQQGYPPPPSYATSNNPSAANAPPAANYGYPPSAQAPPQTPKACTSIVELWISCKNLMDMDVMSKSDPVVVASIQYGPKWIEVGRTENIKNNLNPEFAKPIKCNYYFEMVQNIKFEVYDIDNTTVQLDDDDFLGQTVATLGQVVSIKCFSKKLQLRGGQFAGNSTITVRATEIDNTPSESIQMKFSAQSVDKKDFFGLSDPFLEFKKATHDGSYVLTHRTEYIDSTLNPVWKPFSIDSRTLFGTNPESEIKIICYDHNNSGNHDYIGECKTTYVELQQVQQQKQPKSWTLINPKKLAKKGKSYKGSGTLILNSIDTFKNYTFLDYISTGTQLNFIVAIDFTASNGDPKHPSSLHHYDQYRPNEYMRAISAVGSVLQDYDSDKMFPTLGFGANIPPNYSISHLFALNFNMSNPFCAGVQGILEAYSRCLPQVQLYGPTYVAPVINHAAQFAQNASLAHQPQDYFVLLILTDGVIVDMAETMSAIVKASNLPLSIIIVGVGNADFHDMNVLDGDDGLLKSPTGVQAARDIVQFVPFRQFYGDPIRLTQEVLAEIPQQLVGYYKMRKIIPKSTT